LIPALDIKLICGLRSQVKRCLLYIDGMMLFKNVGCGSESESEKSSNSDTDSDPDTAVKNENLCENPKIKHLKEKNLMFFY
jgi:hypothetical protein